MTVYKAEGSDLLPVVPTGELADEINFTFDNMLRSRRDRMDVVVRGGLLHFGPPASAQELGGKI